MIKILVFALWLISASKGGLNYEDLVDNVKDTYGECLAMMDDARDHVIEVRMLGDIRRRTDGNAGLLEACMSMIKATDTYRGILGRLIGAPKFICPKYIGALDKFLKPVSKKLGKVPLYVASKDGDSSRDFHAKCDGKGPTVVIIQTTTGNVFGGYTDKSWGSVTGYQNAPNSFIFRLVPSIDKYPLKSAFVGYAMYNNLALGPTFGNCNDIKVQSGALSRTDSLVNGYAYTATRHTLNNGIRNFQVKDYAVYPAIPL